MNPRCVHRVLALLVLVLAFPLAAAASAARIDGSSDEAANRSFQRMLQSLGPDQQQALVVALVQINLIGLESAEAVVRNADLQHPSAARVRATIAGMTAPEIVAYAKRHATTTARVEGKEPEPGVPPELLRPLAGGTPSIDLADTTWVIDDTIGSRGKRDVYVLHADHTMTLIESEKKQNGVARWEQAGDEVRLSFGDGYAVKLGHVVDATTMRGDGANKAGFRWTWSATRREGGEAPHDAQPSSS